MDYRLFPPEGWLEAEVGLPMSKSVAARKLVTGALAGEIPALPSVDIPDDTLMMHRGLEALMAAAEGEAVEIDVAGAGTAMRFLTAVAAVTPGSIVTLTGNARMTTRPIGALVDALRELGADISYIDQEGFPPLSIRERRLDGGRVTVDATVSSQFVSALMMVAPLMKQGLTIELAGEPVSMPYARLTAAIMRQAGAEVDIYGGDTIEVKPCVYNKVAWTEEADWSSAAPWYIVAALSGGEVTVAGLDEGSAQPDRALTEIFHRLGVDTEFLPEGGAQLTAHPDAHARLDMDMAPTPDIVPAVVTTCAMLGIPFVLSGIDSLRIKECDRIAALADEMLKVGVVIEQPDAHTIAWDGRRLPITEIPRFATYDDHRMAMALAAVSLYIPGIVIEHSEVVSKSYPGFWQQLAQAGFIIADADAPVPSAEEGDGQ